MPAPIPVLHFLNRFWIGGSERQFIERLRRHPQGFTPVVACFERTGALLPQVLELGFQPIEFPLGGSLMSANTAAQTARIAALIKERGVKLVHCTDFNTNLVGLAAARLAGVPCIVSRVDLGHLRSGFGPWHRRAEKLTSRLSDLVCANAEAVRQLCLREEGCTPEQVVVVRNGLDLPRFDAIAKQPLAPALEVPPGPRVTLVGNLWPVKGHRVLVEAAAFLAARFPDVRIVCAGEGPERDFLEQRIAELGLAKNVFLVGHRLDVPALLARSDIGVLCSSAEGLSNAIIEAMAARLPVVATDVGGNGELVKDEETGFLVPYGDARALADALGRLLEAPERARAMGEKGRRRVETELSLETMAAAYGELYRGLLADAPSAKSA